MVVGFMGGSKKARNISSIANNVKIFGDMAGMASQTGALVAGNCNLHNRGNNHLEIPLEPKPGLVYMQGENPQGRYMLSKNPQGSGGVGRGQFTSIKYTGSCPSTGTQMNNASNEEGEMGEEEEETENLDGERILFLYDIKYQASVDLLKVEKLARGFNVTTYSINSSSVPITQDNMLEKFTETKNVIDNMYDNQAFKYILIFGSIEEVPTYMRTFLYQEGSSYTNQLYSKAACDMMYSFVNDDDNEWWTSWLDTPETWNEPNDNKLEDNYKIIVGRLSPGDKLYDESASWVDGLTDIEKQQNVLNQVNKIIEYEKIIDDVNNYDADDPNTYINMETDYFKKIIGIASNEGGVDLGIDDLLDRDYMRQELVKYSESDLGCVYVELYDDVGSNITIEQDEVGDPGAIDLVDEINEGSPLLLYCGHATEQEFITTHFGVENITDLDSMSNEGMYFLGCIVGCSAASHDESYMSLAENLQTCANKGSIAMFASSALQRWAPPQYMQRTFNDTVINATETLTIGDLFKEAILVDEFLNAPEDPLVGPLSASNKSLWFYTLLGDPSCRYILTVPNLKSTNN